MDKRAFKNFITRRSTIWTASLCMTGVLVLGGIAAVDKARRADEAETESEIGQVAYLEEEITESIEEELFPTLSDEDEEKLAEASGSAAEDDGALPGETDGVEGISTQDGSQEDLTADASAAGMDSAADVLAADGTDLTAEEALEDVSAQVSSDDAAQEASSGEIISEQTLLDAGVGFTEEDSLLWPSAGTILIDYSMDGSVYFPTLNQYKYNPALIIGSEVGNQVLSSTKGIVESISIDEETGNTLVLNIGNGYKLTYGQLKELAVAEGDVVEEGTVLGYVSEPTKYYAKEGGNLYFAMTENGEPVDPVLYLE